MTRRCNLLPILALASLPAATLLAPGCHDDDDTKGFSDIATVERNDSVVALHLYRHTLIPTDPSKLDGLNDGERVAFKGKGRLTEIVSDDDQRWLIDLSEVSGDLTVPIVFDSTAVGREQDLFGSLEGYHETRPHITRDWRRNDWLNTSAFFPSHDDGREDLFALTRVTNDNVEGKSIFWLRLKRARTDTVQLIHRQISVPVNCLRDSAAERIEMRICRFNQYGDTVLTDYVYSYINFME